ncbi:MAG: DrmB family protein [Cyanobium sp.]
MAPSRTRSSRKLPAIGEARQSQVLQLFGPGSMVDLPDYSVLIGGLDYWNTRGCTTIDEPRLLQLVRAATGVPHVELRTPPSGAEGANHSGGSIKALRFPQWSLAQQVSERFVEGRPYRARPLVHFRDGCVKDWKLFEDEEGKLWPLVPIRFVMACPHGHLSDIPWRDFCFRTRNCRNRERLYLLEAGTGNDFTQIYVQSESGAYRKLAEAMVPDMTPLDTCQGLTPWLGPGSRDSDPCRSLNRRGQGEATKNRLLVRSATNAYFTETLSVISLPADRRSLSRRVAENHDNLKLLTDESQVALALQVFPPVRAAFPEVSAAELWVAIQAHRNPTAAADAEPKDEELAVLTGPMEGISDDSEHSLFQADIWQPAAPPSWYSKAIRRVLLIHRLREVQALVGFTRFTPRTCSLGGLPIQTATANRRANLATNLTWVPTSENNGEGLFLEFEPATLEAWAVTAMVQDRCRQYTNAFEGEWLASRGLTTKDFPFPGQIYLLLHSLSHLLITEMALDCGYGASSIRERIYARPLDPTRAGSQRYGILLFTSSSGSEGTLGGLVEAGKRLDRYLRKAFERALLCSNDPFCAEHDPNHPYDIRPTNGAACHGCELIAETSCEQRNDFLDRALVSRTVASHGLEPDPSFWSYLQP